MLPKTSNRERAKTTSRVDQNSEAGFSILETAIALVLMTIVALGAASLFYYSIRNTVTAGDRDLSMAVAQQKMEQLRNVDFLDAALTATVATTPVTITRAGRQYQVYTTIADSNTISGQPTTKTITVRAAPVRRSPRRRRRRPRAGSVTLVDQRSALSVGPNRAL